MLEQRVGGGRSAGSEVKKPAVDGGEEAEEERSTGLANSSQQKMEIDTVTGALDHQSPELARERYTEDELLRRPTTNGS